MRHTKSNRCPVCGGADGDPRGKERRCHGWTTEDGEWCHCTREELAGGIERGPDEAYAHRMRGPCRCGSTHGEAVSGTLPRSDDIEATYDYRDERGNLLFQVVRKTGKRFLQRRPDGDNWIWQTQGVRRVLYRLPELLVADPTKQVIVVEGERDVGTLERAGYLATTNPGGAGKWRFVAQDALEVLRGREVIVVADADNPGREHARVVAASLEGIAKSIRVVEPKAPHKDVTDYVAAGGDVAALLAEPVPQISSDWNVISLADLSEPLPPVPWVCEALGLAPGAVSLVAGYGYSRKTMAMQSLGLSIAAGKPAWGVYRTRPGAFVHLDYEQGRRLTQERYQRLARGMGFELRDLPAGALKVACMPRVYLDEKDIADELMRLVDGAAFVLVDSLRAAFPHADENSSEVRSYLDVLSRVSERTGALFETIHHARKPQQNNQGESTTFAIRGSSALFDACQSVHVFVGEKNTPTMVHHQKDRIRGACVDDFGLTGEDVAQDGDPRWGLRVVHLEPEQMRQAEKDTEDARVELAIRAIEITIKKAGGEYKCNQKELFALSGLGKSDVSYRALAMATSAGRILRGGQYHNPSWRLP